MEELRQISFSHIDQATMQRRFEIYGGNPRLVLMLAPSSRNDTEQLDAALTRSGDLGQILKIANEGLEAEGQIPSPLLQILPQPGGSTCTTTFASPYVADKVYRGFTEQARLEMKKFVLFGEDLHPIATARGWIFERLCHDELPKGKASALERLGRVGTTLPFPLPLNPDGVATVFTDLAFIATQSKVYYRPKIINFPSIDGIIRDGRYLYVLQVTTAVKHPVKVQGLKKIWDAFSGSGVEEMLLVFVLPDCDYTKQTFIHQQEYHTVEGDGYQGHADVLKYITQWRCFAGALGSLTSVV